MADLKIQPGTLRDMSMEELKHLLSDQQEALMNELSDGTVETGIGTDGDENTGVQKTLRRNIARIKTIMNEKDGND